MNIKKLKDKSLWLKKPGDGFYGLCGLVVFRIEKRN